MSPHLRDLDVDAIAARLRAAGDEEAASALSRLRDAVAAQDEALRDLVADAERVTEAFDEDGSRVEMALAPNGFEALGATFGYPALTAFDNAAFERARAEPGGPEMYDGDVALSALDHLLARIHTDARSPEELERLGFVRVEVRSGPSKGILYHEPAVPSAAPAGPGR